MSVVSVNITDVAARGALGHETVCRDSEIAELSDLLCCKTRPCVLLVGHPGVGKSQLVRGLAQRIASKRCDARLSGWRVMETNVMSLSMLGSPSEIVKALGIEAGRDARDQRTVLFVDEAQQVADYDGNPDLMTAIQTLAQSGKIRLVLAVSSRELRVLEKNAPFMRSVRVLRVPELSARDAMLALKAAYPIYEVHHTVGYTPEALDRCVELAPLISASRLPGSAFELLDLAGSLASGKRTDGAGAALRAELEDSLAEIEDLKANSKFHRAGLLQSRVREIYERLEPSLPPSVLPAHVEEAASRLLAAGGLATISAASSSDAEEFLSARVVGQPEAVKEVADVLARAVTGIRDQERPVGVLLFVGPTGTGKTELARRACEYLYGDSSRLIRMDMGEYNEAHSVSKIIGSPPGYLGYDDGGQLTNQVRSQPRSVLLLDEIEKAHSSVFNCFLRAIDDGWMTDSHGVRVDFRDVLFIMTSNSGSDSEGASDGEVLGSLKKVFRPEFMNRLDSVVVFRRLGESSMMDVVRLFVSSAALACARRGYELIVSDEAVKLLSEIGYDPTYGARHIRRAVQRYVSTPVARYVSSGGKSRRIKLDLFETEEGIVPGVIEVPELLLELQQVPSLPRARRQSKKTRGAADSCETKTDIA